jgi:hypothetical protein
MRAGVPFIGLKLGSYAALIASHCPMSDLLAASI